MEQVYYIWFVLFLLFIAFKCLTYKNVKSTPEPEKKDKLKREDPQSNEPFISVKISINDSMRDSSSSNSDYMQIEAYLQQMLESADLLLTTKNVDIFLSRYDFMKKLAEKLVNSVNSSTYYHSVNSAVDRYKELYYNKFITEEQLEFIIKPSIIYSENIFGEYLYNCFERFCNKMEDEISSLKTSKAKERRIEKVGETYKLIEPYINSPIAVKYASDIHDLIYQKFGVECEHINYGPLK